MIQLNKSLTNNSVAFYPETAIPANATAVRIYYSQDINLNTGSFDASIASKLNWVLLNVGGNSVPSPSGQYTLSIYTLDNITYYIWNTTALNWEDADTQWDLAGSGDVGTLVATERAYVSGSNESGLTTYLSPGQAGYYITYQD